MAKRGKCVRRMRTSKGMRCAKYAGSKPKRRPCKVTLKVSGYKRKAHVATYRRRCPK